MIRTLLTIMALLFSQRSLAQAHYEFYQGIRQMAMGGAAIGVVDDETALLLNPADLAKLREPYLTLADPVLDVGSQDDQIAGGYANLPGLTDPQKALNQANANPNGHLHGMGEVFPSLVLPYFGLGFLGRAEEDSELYTGTNKYSLHYTNDFAIVIGFGLRFWGGIVKLGVNGRLIDRSQIWNDTIDPTSTTLTTGSLLNEGVGLGTDVGLILTAPIRWLPSLAVVGRDIGRTSYNLQNGEIYGATTTWPDSTPQTLNGSFTISPIMSNRIRSMWTVEYEDITNAFNSTISQQHYHAGFEINFSDFLFLRGGYNTGYWTGGVEFAVRNYQLQVTSYGQEVGTGSTTQEDRRYMGGFAIRF